MNKKVSTIFAMAALMGGVFCSSAYAQEVNLAQVQGDPVASNEDLTSKQVFLTVGGEVIGAKWTDATETTFEYGVFPAAGIEKADLSQYLWTVSQGQLPTGEYTYTFTNVKTGQPIKFLESAGSYTLVTDKNKKAGTGELMQTLFLVGSNQTAQQTAWTGATSSDVKLAADVTLELLYDNGEFDVQGAEAGESISLNLLKPGITVDESDLNELYNSAGFNFTLDGSKLADVTNIFGDKKVLAIKVAGATKSVNDVNYEFPAGTYFATSTPRSLKANEITTGVTDYDFLTRCTFIAIDSDENILDDADQQKAGNGFTLTEVKGSDLVTYAATWNAKKGAYEAIEGNKAAGDQVAVSNACFTVLESTTSENVYALSVANARYKEAANADKQVETRVYITAGAKISEIYTSASADANDFIFKFSESSAVKPSALLFKGDTAAIYNIRLYKANGADDTRNGKYLTTTANGAEFIAKGAVLADTDAPAYQWVISKVDGSDITFTNRETGATLTTQLFDEGNGVYSLAKTNVPSEPTNYTYYVVDEKGGVVEGNENGNGATFGFNYTTGTRIQLIPSKAVNYAGYLNVEDETLMTLSFGRDIAPTSNKLYPVYDEKTGDFAAHLSSDVADAAQWQLVKSVNDNHPKRYNYVYANGNLINTKNNGDVVYAYTYRLELVNDGKVVEDNFLKVTNSGATIVNDGTESKFYIQENIDGSVSLKTSRVSNASVLLDDWSQKDWNIGDFEKYTAGNNFSLISTNDLWENADYVKTYLIAEAPAISLPAVEGHYSFVSEQGNYITMNEERDGLTVKEDSEAIYLYVTDEEEVVPSFYITKGVSAVEGQRMYLFNPQDSVDYYVATGDYKKNYEWVKDEVTKAIFKSAAISESRDTLTTEIKGESTLVAQEASNAEKVEGGLDMFKMQILEDPESDGLYVVRNVGTMKYLYSWNGMLGWSDKTNAMKFNITGAEAPTANEGVAATEVKVIATDGAINIKNAAGKNVVVSTILGHYNPWPDRCKRSPHI